MNHVWSRLRGWVHRNRAFIVAFTLGIFAARIVADWVGLPGWLAGVAGGAVGFSAAWCFPPTKETAP
jgi:hypothetical protein